jgi:hypothetical protein
MPLPPSRFASSIARPSPRALEAPALLVAALLLGTSCTAGTGSSGGRPGGGTQGGGAPPSTDPSCEVPAAWTTPAAATTVVGDGTAGSCTAAAVQAAVKAGGLITFNCGAAAVTIPVTTAITLDNGKKPTILDGGGKITLDGGGKTRILNVASWQLLSLRNLTLLNASTVPTAADFDAQGKLVDEGRFVGAAVTAGYQAKVEVIHARFQGNRARQAAAIFIGSDGDLTIVDSAFVDNSAWDDGAIKSLLSGLTIVNSLFEGNSGTLAPDGIPGASSFGGTGALATDGARLKSYIDGGLGTGGTISLCGSTFRNNTSARGGGAIFLWAYAPDRILVKSSTFEGNQGGGLGGAGRVSVGYTDHSYSCSSANHCTIITPGTVAVESSSFLSNTSQGNAGALYMDCFGDCVVRNSTFYGNNAGGVGSVIQYVGWGPEVGGPGPGLHFSNVTFSHNGDQRGQLNLFGSGFIIDNSVFESSNPVCWGVDQTHATGSHVIQLVPSGAGGGTTPCVTGATVITTDPAPLPAAPADNGGPTWTILPAAGSPLIGAGAGCEQIDQRGKARDTAKCTVGAVEP